MNIREKVKITDRQMEILASLEKAPKLQKNAYYVSGKLGISYNTSYTNIKIMVSMGLIEVHKSPTGKVSHIPNQEIIARLKGKYKEFFI